MNPNEPVITEQASIKQSAPSITNETKIVFASISQRAGANILDVILSLAILFGFALVLSLILKSSVNLQGPITFIGLVGYFAFMEKSTGQTIGKKMVGIKVVSESGDELTWNQAIVRNLLRVVDQLPFFYIVGIVLATSSPLKQRFGDKIAKTIVIKS